jgi:hypothetical protein
MFPVTLCLRRYAVGTKGQEFYKG